MKKVTEDAPAEEVPVLSTSSEKTINTQLLDSLDPNQLDTLLAELLMRKQSTQKPTQESTSSSIIQEREQPQPQPQPILSTSGIDTSLLSPDDFLDLSSSDDSDDYICLYYNYNGMNSHLFKPNERVKNVLQYFFAIRSGFSDEDTSDYCLVTITNLTRTLPIYKTIKECGLEDGTQVESIILNSIFNSSSRIPES